jgi:hypothetical protein
MGSSLLDICNALAAVPVSFNFEDQSHHNLQATPLVGNLDYMAHTTLPARIVLPPGVYGQGVSGYQYHTFDKRLVTVTWNIADVLLFELVALGQMIGIKYAGLAAYVAAYLPAVNEVRKLTPNSLVTNINPAIGIIEYPRDSGRFYNGVQMVVSVSETFC